MWCTDPVTCPHPVNPMPEVMQHLRDVLVAHAAPEITRGMSEVHRRAVQRARLELPDRVIAARRHLARRPRSSRQVVCE